MWLLLCEIFVTHIFSSVAKNTIEFKTETKRNLLCLSVSFQVFQSNYSIILFLFTPQHITNKPANWIVVRMYRDKKNCYKNYCFLYYSSSKFHQMNGVISSCIHAFNFIRSLHAAIKSKSIIKLYVYSMIIIFWVVYFKKKNECVCMKLFLF